MLMWTKLRRAPNLILKVADFWGSLASEVELQRMQ